MNRRQVLGLGIGDITHYIFTDSGKRKYTKEIPIERMKEEIDYIKKIIPYIPTPEEIEDYTSQRDKLKDTKIKSRSKGGKIGGRRHYVKKSLITISLIAQTLMMQPHPSDMLCQPYINERGQLIEVIYGIEQDKEKITYFPIREMIIKPYVSREEVQDLFQNYQCRSIR